MLLRDHAPQDQLGQFVLGSSYVGGRSSKISATEERSIATGDADVVFFLSDTDTMTSTQAQTLQGFMSIIDPSTIQETITQTQYSFMALLSNDILSRTESIMIDRLVSADVYFPGMIEKQAGLINNLSKTYFGTDTIVNFRRNVFVPEAKESVMPFIVTSGGSLPIGAGTATTFWGDGAFNIVLTKNLQNYEDTLTYLGYINTYTG